MVVCQLPPLLAVLYEAAETDGCRRGIAALAAQALGFTHRAGCFELGAALRKVTTLNIVFVGRALGGLAALVTDREVRRGVGVVYLALLGDQLPANSDSSGQSNPAIDKADAAAVFGTNHLRIN